MNTNLTRSWLFVTAVVSGGIVMAIELLGARMLSVVFGGSLTVWAGMISVTLLSLAAGYFAGGYLSDRFPHPGLLYALLLLASLLTALCPYAKPVLHVCVTGLGLEWGAVAGSAILFFFPLALFGVTGPFVIRLLNAGGGRAGRTAGTIYAVATLGSVAGTLLAGLWLIPHFGLSVSFKIAAAAGAVTAGAGLVMSVGWRAMPAWLVPLICLWLPQATRVGVVYRAPDGDRVEVKAVGESLHGRMEVLSKGSYRLLVVDGIVQTGVPENATDGAKGQMLRRRYHPELIPYLTDNPERSSALLIGLAGGMTARMLGQYGMQLDCVEIDRRVIAMAREWFAFKGTAIEADGRVYLETCGKRYDFCIIDAYAGDMFPVHLASREAFESVRRVLTPSGVVVVNFIGAPQGRAFASICRTMKEVFPEQLAIKSETGDDVQPITLFASARKIEFNNGWLEYIEGGAGADPVSRDLAQLTVQPALENALVLTDDHNPMDFIRASEAVRWRQRTLERIGWNAAL